MSDEATGYDVHAAQDDRCYREARAASEPACFPLFRAQWAESVSIDLPAVCGRCGGPWPPSGCTRTVADLTTVALAELEGGIVRRMCGVTPEPIPDGIRITPEMIAVAAEVLWMHPLLDVPVSLAEELAREMLERSLPLSRI